jgi:two-component system sensor histidine kinase CpxA
LRVALELARQRAGPDAEGALDRTEPEAERLDSLIGQILTLTRLEAGGAAPRERVDLAALVSETAADADFEARGRGVSVRAADLEPCVVDGDARLLRSAVENVVRNAVAYTAEGTEVEVRLVREGGDAVVTVRDHGPGVPDEALAAVFQPFFRVEEARDRQTGGTGLGLAITDRAVRYHGGTVTAANAAGGGLAVEIRLPLPKG